LMDNPVYVTYTSGSTGKPKGIVMPHRALLNLLEWQYRYSRMPEGSRTIQFASLSFDVSFQDMFSTLNSGGTVVMISEGERQDIAGLSQVLIDNNVHRIFIPAVALQQLAEGFCAEERFSAPLRRIIAGSEQLQITPSIARLFTQLKDCSLHNEYGPSEAHVVTSYVLTGAPEEWPIRAPIGRPISNISIYILDHHWQPAPIGVPGELYIGGVSLARGYLSRSDLTAERFVVDPFSKRAGARMYRTGDLARWRSDGNLEFLGRTDKQLKIRGFRIEPGEIEAALRERSEVREAVVVMHEDRLGEKRLVSYVVPAPGQSIDPRALRQHMAEKLPDYMVPTTVVELEALPLTSSGKLDRKALPEPEIISTAAWRAPRSPEEAILCGLYAEVLGLERVGIDDNFFELGGHSLLATRLVSRIRTALDLELSMRSVFEFPVVADLAERLKTADKVRIPKLQRRGAVSPVISSLDGAASSSVTTE
jgi:amino acid adenylation domain-containing protein